MQNDIINSLSKEIVDKFANKPSQYEGKMDIKDSMNEFLNSSISIALKLKVLELLYMFQLYSGAYTGPDPRGKSTIFSIVHIILGIKNEEEIASKIKDLEKKVELLKGIESNPINTTKIKLEDKEKYKSVIF